MRRMTLKRLQRLLPDAAIEEVGERRELVIYTGLSRGTYDPETEQWTEQRRLVPMPDDGVLRRWGTVDAN